MAELVRGVDADAADAADRDGETDLLDGQRVLDAGVSPSRAPGAHEAHVLHREEGVGDPAVVAVLLERLDDLVGRVVGVEPGEQVERGEISRNTNGPTRATRPEPGRGQSPEP